MSWLFSQALVAEYSAASSSAGALSALSSGSPTPRAFLPPDRMTAFSRPFRFGMTFGPLTETLGAELLTWFLAASRARTSAWPAKAPASTASAQACGDQWRGSLARFDPASRLWRTAQLSLLADSNECSVTWPRSGMTADGQCWELPTLVPPTSATGSGLWLPTPCTVDSGSMFNRSDSPNAALRPTLGAMAKHSLWPTVTVNGNYNRKGASAKSGDGLAVAVANWPTPTASLGTKGGRVTPRKGKEGGTLIEAVSARRWPTPHGFSPDGQSNGPSGNELGRAVNQSLRAVATPLARDWRSGKASQATHDRNSRPLSEQIGGSLNPTWVEWLMGWKPGWTDLKPLAMDKCHCAPQAHGGC